MIIMSATRKRTFRVRNLPSHVDRLQTVELLIRLNNALGPSDNITICSLASSLNPWERPPTKIATMVLQVEPSLFQGKQNEWVLPAKNHGFYHDIIIDVHFFGFTVLNEVDPRNYAFDCIAISGLASHPFGSWKNRNETTSFMWLRDRLPRDMPYARSIIYGYDTELLNSESTQNIDDLATSFIVELRLFGRSSISAKPLAFFAHSLGGIILKRALVLLAESGSTERFMLDCVRQIILFGVPHLGMTIAHLLPMVQKQPNQSLVEFIATDSVKLKELGEQFDGITTTRNVQIVSVYETKRSQLPQQNTDGTWSRNGPYELLVDRNSAVHKSSLPANTLPINEDHSNMVKFSEGDVGYRGVLSFLFELKQCLDILSQEASTIPERAVESLEPGANEIPFFDPSLLPETPESMTRAAKAQVSEQDRNKVQSKREERLETRLKAMMKSLDVFSDERRLNEIETATTNTFDWIFINETLGFSSWARSGCGIYWIKGKPGSGKSTLMKYILRDHRTETLLNTFQSSDRRYINASFFFHDRGSHLQKSFEGLLGSILNQILLKEPILQKEILHLTDHKMPSISWSLADLERAFKILSDEKDHAITISLFLDALDEFDGPLEVITSWINLLSGKRSSGGIRFQICFSSRPVNIFVDEFDHCPGFQIQDHTSDDIGKFAVAKFEESEALKRLFRSGDDSDSLKNAKLIDDIVLKAQGVFIWVRLIMRELHMASVDGASRTELLEVLMTCPENLEDFYVRILEKIPKKYCFQSYVMIEVVLRSRQPLILDALEGIVACAPCHSFEDCKKALFNQTSPVLSDNAERRLKSRTGQLLEVLRNENGSTIQFMHQTIKEFAEKPNFRRYLLRDTIPVASENGHSFLTKYLLTSLLLNSFERIGRVPKNITQYGLLDCYYHANLAESTTGKSQYQFMNSLDNGRIPRVSKEEILYHEQKKLSLTRPASYPTIKIPINSAASFATVSGLVLYVKEQLCKPNFANSNSTISLLYFAVTALGTKSFMFRNENRHILNGLKQTVKLLLHSGADKTFTRSGMNPFQVLLATLSNAESFIERTELIEVAEMFLDNGQDPNSPVVTGLYPFDLNRRLGTALHMAPLRLLQCLVRNNADVNALNEDGLTPLDCRIVWASRLQRQGSSYTELYEAILTLLQHGGQVTSRTDATFLEVAEQFKTDFDDCSLFGPPPRLPNHLELNSINANKQRVATTNKRRHSVTE